MNIAELILRHAKTRPDAQAVIDGERAMNYGPMADLVLRTATQLLAVGVVANDRVGLCLKDSLDHIVSLLAVTWLGAVAVPLDWRARPTEKSADGGRSGRQIGVGGARRKANHKCCHRTH